MIEEKVGTLTTTPGTTRVSYVWSPVYVDAMIARDRDADNNGSLEERLYPTHDANFNVTALVNTTGTVVERYAYDPFGTVTFQNASGITIAASTVGWQYLHQGGRLNAASSLYSFRNREYSSSLGRWVNMDPIRYEAGDVNLYRYNGNNAVLNVDPNGQLFWIPIIVIAVVLIGAGTAQAPTSPGEHVHINTGTDVADLVTSIAPGVSDARDVIELTTGRDAVTGERLTRFGWFLTAFAVAIPILGASPIRHAFGAVPHRNTPDQQALTDLGSFF